MRGVSEIIVIILILMIAVSLSALGYVTFTNLFSKIKTSSEQSMSNTVSSLLSQMTIESVVRGTGGADTEVFVRNTGKVDLANFSAYDDDAYVGIRDGTPAGGKISSGEVKNINITGTSVIAAGSVIKITSAQGTIAMKSAT